MREAIVPSDRYLVVDTITGLPVQSLPTRAQADHACLVVNEQEVRYGRPERYMVETKRLGT